MERLDRAYVYETRGFEFERADMTPKQIAQRITSKWPNLHMECELDELEQDIQDAIREAVFYEREACAKLCDERERSWKERGNGYANGCADCAQAIRERK